MEKLPDMLDAAGQLTQALADDEVGRIRRAAANMPKGKPGDCDLCGSWSGRLVNGVCAPCRDRYKLK